MEESRSEGRYAGFGSGRGSPVQGGHFRHRSDRDGYLVVQRTRDRAHLKDLYLTRC